MEKVLLVSVRLDSQEDQWSMDDIAAELEALVAACGVQVVDHVRCHLAKPTPNFYIGRGKAEELALAAQEHNVDAVVFGCDLSGTQQRNLEEVISKKTIDRTQLILDIFAHRARSPEGKMQVELAQSLYLMPRLIGKGLILSRTGGGIGTSGPGEQRLETDRRRIRKKIDKLRADLAALSNHRETNRKRRKESAIPSAALVGYTGAGKSTLLNALTAADQPVSGHLFTTLDPLYKNLKLPSGQELIISDTVGFLHDLPHHLIESFKATLEELTETDILIHLLDAAHPKVEQHSKAVLDVLKEFGAQDKPVITVLNKIDLVDDPVWLARIKDNFAGAVAISAKLKLNLEALLERIQENFSGRIQAVEIMVRHARMDVVDLLYRQAKVESVEYLQKGIKVKATLPKELFQKLLHDREIEEI